MADCARGLADRGEAKVVPEPGTVPAIGPDRHFTLLPLVEGGADQRHRFGICFRALKESKVLADHLIRSVSRDGFEGLVAVNDWLIRSPQVRNCDSTAD